MIADWRMARKKVLVFGVRFQNTKDDLSLKLLALGHTPRSPEITSDADPVGVSQ